RRDVFEIQIAQVAKHAHALAAGQHSQQVQLAREFEISQHTVAARQIFQSAKGGHVCDRSVRRALEYVRSFVAEADDVFHAIVLQIAHETTSVFGTNDSGQKIALRSESAVAVLQQTKAALTCAHEQAELASVAQIEDGDRAIKVRRAAEDWLSGIGKDNFHAIGGGLFELERKPRLRVLAHFEGTRISGRAGFLLKNRPVLREF